MGIRDRFKRRVKTGISSVKALAAVIHDEANHPGRPAPHMAARNPMWGGESGEAIENETGTAHSAPEPPIEHPVPEERRAPDGEEFWFLKDDDAEGWSETNPGLVERKEDD